MGNLQGLTILDRDDRGLLAVRLADLLALVGPEGRSSHWRVCDIEAVGESKEELEILQDEAGGVDGARLYLASEKVDQIIDGTFSAFIVGSQKPWLIIRAVDSSAFDVETNRREVLDRIRASYRQVEEMPQ